MRHAEVSSPSSGRRNGSTGSANFPSGRKRRASYVEVQVAHPEEEAWGHLPVSRSKTVPCPRNSKHAQLVGTRSQIAVSNVCVCGNIFASDAVFCRRCGVQRQEEVIVPSPMAQSVMSVFDQDSEQKPDENKGKVGLTVFMAAAKFKKHNLTAQDRILMHEEFVKLPMFESLGGPVTTALAEVVERHIYPKDREIVKEGTMGSSLILVLRGHLDMFVGGVKVQTCGAGQYFGETMLLGIEDCWNACLHAASSCTVCEIRRKPFYETLEQFPDDFEYFSAIRNRHRNVELFRVGTLVNPCQLFRGLTTAAMRKIDVLMVRRIFFPGQTILEEASLSDELFILVEGEVSKRLTDREVCRECASKLPTSAEEDNAGEVPSPALTDGFALCGEDSATPRPGSRIDGSAATVKEETSAHCFGELGLLGIQQTSSASMVAESICHVRTIHRTTFLKTLEDHSECLEYMAKVLAKRYDAQFDVGRTLHDIQIFKAMDVSDAFLDFLAKHLEGRIFLPGSKLIDEEAHDDRCMYILSQGFVEVFKEGIVVANLGPGAVIGEITALGLASKRSSTCVAQESCFTQVLHQCVIVHALELFPEERQKVLLMASALHKQKSDGSEQDRHASNGEQSQTQDFAGTLKRSPFFSVIDPSFVDELAAVAHDRIYMPGDFVIEMGRRGESMFIMVSGNAGVFVYEAGEELCPISERKSEPPPKFNKKTWTRVGALKEGSISGELAMLGVTQVRGATIEAETICTMWEITQENALMIIDRFPSAQAHFAEVIKEHLDRSVSGRMMTLPLFQSFDKKFRTLLGLYCERHAYFPGHHIVREGRKGDQFFIVNLGSVALEKNGMPIKTYMPGSHFGSTVMLGIDKIYLGALIAQTMCHVLTISRSTYLLALEQYPSAAQNTELKHKEKIATQLLRDAAKKIATKRVLWRRYQWMMTAHPVLTESEMIVSVLQAWRQRVVDKREWDQKKQSEQNLYDVMMDRWWKRHLEDQELLRHKRHLADILRHNCGRNETPLFPKMRGSNVRYWMGQSPVEKVALSPRCPSTATRYSGQASRHSSSVAVRSAGGPSPLPPQPNSARSPNPSCEVRSSSACGRVSTYLGSAGTAVGTSNAISPPRQMARPCAGLVRNVLWSARAASPSSF